MNNWEYRSNNEFNEGWFILQNRVDIKCREKA